MRRLYSQYLYRSGGPNGLQHMTHNFHTTSSVAIKNVNPSAVARRLAHAFYIIKTSLSINLLIDVPKIIDTLHTTHLNKSILYQNTPTSKHPSQELTSLLTKHPTDIPPPSCSTHPKTCSNTTNHRSCPPLQSPINPFNHRSLMHPPNPSLRLP